MWGKIVVVFRIVCEKTIAGFRWLFGTEPDSTSNDGGKFAETDGRSDSKSSERPPALPVTGKYKKIDWDNAPPEYRKRRSVLSFRERECYRLLRRLMGRENHVLSMVRMADVLWLSKGTEDDKFHRNNILCKHFDYVICDKLKFEPILVVELDDPKHQWEHRWQVDDFKDRACKVAGLPILRIKVQEKYDEAEISKKIHQVLSSIKESE